MSEYFDELMSAFESDPEIDELGIIMGPAPPATVLTEHKLGVSMAVLKPMFKYAISEFYRLLKQNRDISPSSDAYRVNCTRCLKLTTAVLVVKGDIAMALNYRKEMILLGLLSEKLELNFLKMLFTKHPKSPGAWEHRRWCLRGNPMSDVQVEEERELCRRMAELYPKNYYAWSHRLWLLPKMSSETLSNEWTFCNDWLYRHVSDHSAASHGTQVLQAILKEGKASVHSADLAVFCVNKLLSALKTNQELIVSRPGSESIWCQRRLIFMMLLDVMKDLMHDEEMEEARSQYLADFISIDWTVYQDRDGCDSDDSAQEKRRVPFSSMSLDKVNCSRSSFLISLLLEEHKFCHTRCIDLDAWNFDKQRRYSLRYLLYIFHHVQSKSSELMCSLSRRSILTDSLKTAMRQIIAVISSEGGPI